MKNKFNIFLISVFILNAGFAQTSSRGTIVGMMTYANKVIETIEQNDRVVTKTIFDKTQREITQNAYFNYRFQKNNTYFLTAIGDFETIDTLQLYIFSSKNGELTKVEGRYSTGTNIELKFNPPATDDYYVFVNGTFILADSKESVYGLIIDKEKF